LHAKSNELGCCTFMSNARQTFCTCASVGTVPCSFPAWIRWMIVVRITAGSCPQLRPSLISFFTSKPTAAGRTADAAQLRCLTTTAGRHPIHVCMPWKTYLHLEEHPCVARALNLHPPRPGSEHTMSVRPSAYHTIARDISSSTTAHLYETQNAKETHLNVVDWAQYDLCAIRLETLRVLIALEDGTARAGLGASGPEGRVAKAPNVLLCILSSVEAPRRPPPYVAPPARRRHLSLISCTIVLFSRWSSCVCTLSYWRAGT
jgi:hypothetical protein